ncbi:unnamed protein product [Musa acuminata subsp. malaccensis]|uniref:(wild Malaysian banana) hypothetical protein n=1 Tax=Musa acuminata subsp. malaccensis TaxID=214687 RepID=A0A804L7I3_MUSAM|nr:unnamed protein product [Musa acuminata subsp. malaccensis]
MQSRGAMFGIKDEIFGCCFTNIFISSTHIASFHSPFLTSTACRHFINRILNVHAPEWSGEIRSIVYSTDGSSVSVVYRVTLYGTDAEIYREASGTASVKDTEHGDPVQKAEAMAFRRACARLGLGLHLYHEDTS